MPSKTYSGLDAVANTFSIAGTQLIRRTQNPANLDTLLSTLVTENAPGHYTFVVSLTGEYAGVTDVPTFVSTVPINTIITSLVTLDYDPDIPDDALITNITVRIPRSVNLTFGVNAADPTNGYRLNAHSSTYGDMFTPDSGAIAGLSKVINESFAGSGADIELFDYGGVPANRLTKGQLITNYSGLNFGLNQLGLDCFAQASVGDINQAQLLGNFEIGASWFLTVTYDQEFTWNFSVSQQTPLDEDVEVVLTSDPDDEFAVDFEQVNQIDIEFPDPNNPGSTITINVPQLSWSQITTNRMRFTFPSFSGYQPTVVSIVLHSTQFSGSVARQMYTIFFASATGMYQLDMNATSDTLYIEDDPGSTIEVKIPNPMFRPGFFGK